MKHRRAARVACMAVVAAACALVAMGIARQPTGSKPVAADDGLDPTLNYIVVIPKATYQSIVISPQDDGGAPARRSVPFVIRSQDAAGRISDFAVYVRAGEASTLNFPGGWSTPTEAALFAPKNVTFAAWGVSVGLLGQGTSAGKLVRFEPLGRDPRRDERDRERSKRFDEFLREVERDR